MPRKTATEQIAAAGGGAKRKYPVGTYRIDFVVYYTNGTIEHIEVKGHWTQLAKYKWAIFCANHPEFKTRVITERDIPDGF